MCKCVRYLFIITLLWPVSAISQQDLFDHFTVKDGLASNQVFDVVQDMEGNLWFATSKGICRFNGLDFRCYGTQNGINGEVLGVQLDYSGRIWCYTAQGELYMTKRGHFNAVSVSQRSRDLLSNNIVNTLYVDRLNNVWVSTVISPELLKISNGKMEKIELSEDHSFFILEVESNGFVWGANKNSNKNNKLRFKSSTFTLSQKGEDSKSCFVHLNDGTKLFAKDYELIHFNNDRVIGRAFVEKNIESIYQDSRGKIWVGLYMGGVLCYTTGDINSGSPINYLGSKTVTSVLEDNAGNIWLTTNGNGLYHLSAHPNLTYKAPPVFSSTNTEEIEVVRNPIIAKNQPITASNLDFRVISTDVLRYDTIPPRIYISGVKVMCRDTTVMDQYELAYDQNFIKINYVGFAYNNPEALQYKYKLKGINEHWVYTNSTFADYTTLPPGEYRFIVKAMNKNGYWSEVPAVIKVIIKKPYWQMWWFMAMTASFGALAILLVVFLWIRSVKSREQVKAEINKRIGDMELKALRAQMNPHFIFNTMSSIQHYITNNDTEKALKYLSKFAKLMRSIMDNSKRPVIPIKEELSALKLYLELESMRFKNKFTYDINIDESVDVHYDEIPAMLIQPYAENAILHGIGNKEGKGHLSITLQKQNGMVICKVEDDGVGRKRAMEIRGNKKSTHKSMGMEITRERLEILNITNDSNLSVNVTDLEDDTGTPTGTRVEIFVPSD